MLKLIRCVIALAGLSTVAYAQSYRASNLTGITQIGVTIEDLDSEAEKAGLHGSDIQRDVELKLRMAGIKVVAGSPLPWLYVRVTVVLNPDGHAAASIEEQFNDSALLSRNGSGASVITWSKCNVYLGGVQRLPNDVRSAVKDLVDAFINDWLSVNPK